MNFEHRPTASLKPYTNNARTHSPKQIKQIARSIERFGFNNPVLIDDDDLIIAGHGRVEAAKLLKLKTVPCVRLSHLSEQDKRAYILADNRLAEKSGWDNEVLAIELQNLVDVGFDLDAIGFEPAETDLIIEGIGDESDQPENQIPDAPDEPPVSRSGDVWQLGKHFLVCGDSTSDDAYQLLMGHDLADFVFTDPPYNVRIDGHVSGLGNIRHREFAMASGEMSEGQFTKFLADVYELMRRYSVDGSIHQVCMDWRHMREMLAAGDAHYSELKNVCIWNKSNAGMGTFYRSKHELVFIWKNGDAPHINTFELGQHGRHRSNVWDYDGVNSMKAGRLDELAMHPTVKPVALVADAIKDCSKRGNIVLDPFCGSGTILIAAEKTGRRARAIEIDPGYVDVAIRRWQTYTGKVARLAPLSETFEEVAEARASGTTTSTE
ncbi:site-specific DNA-methyltransferase [Bradyrhizobium sp. 4]|uniref:site-specific DNA-methyltransferase n=1 Tax=unclassified Bradyrhizobium TaxID=2631580 RepID=UPI001FF9FA24|nr:MULTISPECIES: DNA methyltransferase [unclassified Bradyrhizobium]MCK1397086.1 site-specific DNA-methyltransferase [Bradyrhizobium sp. 39]MCK1752876.1 site-specific DNA-methyltransferase [Bradyrhizobium sp. 135]UPJ37073.1 site-specific DNA-methyltransferase [Bradyrhizobium sp. 4]